MTDIREKIEKILLGFNFTYGVNEGRNIELAKEIRNATVNQIIALFSKYAEESKDVTL